MPELEPIYFEYIRNDLNSTQIKSLLAEYFENDISDWKRTSKFRVKETTFRIFKDKNDRIVTYGWAPGYEAIIVGADATKLVDELRSIADTIPTQYVGLDGYGSVSVDIINKVIHIGMSDCGYYDVTDFAKFDRDSLLDSIQAMDEDEFNLSDKVLDKYGLSNPVENDVNHTLPISGWRVEIEAEYTPDGAIFLVEVPQLSG